MKRKLALECAVHMLLSTGAALMVSGCTPRDEGRALVNASGLSTNEVITLLKTGADVIVDRDGYDAFAYARHRKNASDIVRALDPGDTGVR
jgi:hypothetical protein